jgi:hypothetical protein
LYGHHRTRRSLSYSTRSQCLICRLLYIGERNSARKPVKDTGYWSVLKIDVKDRVVTVEVNTDNENAPYVFEPISKDTNITLDLPEHTDSPQTWKLINGWVSSCNAGHRRCQSQVETDFLPTRMLEIDDINEPVTYRLVKGVDCTPRTCYTALSYCWG